MTPPADTWNSPDTGESWEDVPDGHVLVVAGTETKTVSANAEEIINAIKELKRELGWASIVVEAKKESGETIPVPGPSAVQRALDQGVKVFFVYRQEEGA